MQKAFFSKEPAESNLIRFLGLFFKTCFYREALWQLGAASPLHETLKQTQSLQKGKKRVDET
jgi:hypothetical protein